MSFQLLYTCLVYNNILCQTLFTYRSLHRDRQRDLVFSCPLVTSCSWLVAITKLNLFVMAQYALGIDLTITVSMHKIIARKGELANMFGYCYWNTVTIHVRNIVDLILKHYMYTIAYSTTYTKLDLLSGCSMVHVTIIIMSL